MAALALGSFPSLTVERAGRRNARKALSFVPLGQKRVARRTTAVRVCAKADSSREEVKEASKGWFERLPMHAKAGVASAAASLTLAQGAMAHANLEGVQISDVIPGVIFASGMIVAGYYFAASHHEESDAKTGTKVCYSLEEEGEELGSQDEVYACEIREPEVDLYRDTAVRYLGYSNECGEAFRPLVGDFWANMTYVIAVSYVLADARDKGIKAKQGSAIARAAEVFKRIDVGGNGYLTFDEVRTAFRELRVPLSLDQIKGYFRKADVYRNNIITFDEWMWSVERADTELAMLMDAGAVTVSPDDVVPNAVSGLKVHSALAVQETQEARAKLAEATKLLSDPKANSAEVLQSILVASSRLETVEAELSQTGESVERISALQYNWGTGESNQTTLLAAVASVDALVWQMTASVIMPGFTINRFVTLTALLVAQYLPDGSPIEAVAPYIPTVVGLAVIPFIVTPLDVLADVLLDVTMRRLIFASIDHDHTGKLTLEELVAKLQTRPEYLPRDKIVELFNEMDLNGDGAISMEEWSSGGFQLYKKYLKKYGDSTEMALTPK
mmetsp:Transcript_26818/g.58448  ORF Transcript_26818/g.58448 Transcript_26818/m.58448 type:complete len:559 (-) Transcript_26818:520-2196(-)|eukprot:CAMPEP_0118922274 /NCGR_PEP_ID=MMETSP1169-20130426/1254_1 /TAXON_ID=36882 /ORGANISM="Pyramimonas obovata, Strain CCMP722" /LENGTH=558 /DNA_ID=CAMNT_0006863113 /DNA_START=155 /DNA_END=1831 /DNA_ORIENTATION=-